MEVVKSITNGVTILPYSTHDNYLDDILDEEDRLVVLDTGIAVQRLEKQNGGYIEIWESGEMVKDFLVVPIDDRTDNNAVRSSIKAFFAGQTLA